MRDYPKTVVLRDGRTVVLRPLAHGDFDQLYAFFQTLPEEGRLFLRHNVGDAALIRHWTDQIDFEHVIPLIAEDGGRIVADGTLHIETHSWMRHMGLVRLVIAETHRNVGLGTLITRELIAIAEERGLEKLQVHLIDDDHAQVKLFQLFGFKKVAVLEDAVKDQMGKSRNLAIMINDVTNLGRIVEDWIQDSTIPAFRVPGAGA
jgi:N-acetylglutamate synthase-like GNAT family acetyltransferase